jgi:hypothetical protein
MRRDRRVSLGLKEKWEETIREDHHRFGNRCHIIAAHGFERPGCH